MLWRRKNIERHCPVCRENLAGVTDPACPACDRPFDPEDASTTSPHAVAYCRSCGYDTLGIDAGPCPECGDDYDPLDRKRFSTTPNRTMVFRKRALRVALLSVLVMVIVVLVQRTIIPRPGMRPDGSIAWTTWLWLDEAYGRETLRPAPNTLNVHVWEDRVVRVEGVVQLMAPAPPRDPESEDDTPRRIRIPSGPVRTDAAPPQAMPFVPAPATLPPAAVLMEPTGELATYSVEREGDTWTVTVGDAGVPWTEILLAFNSTRVPSEVMGVRIAGADRTINEAPFEVVGDGRDVLQALVDHYGLAILPGVTVFDPDHVWALDDDNQIVRQHVSVPQGEGVFVPLIHGARISRIEPNLR